VLQVVEGADAARRGAPHTAVLVDVTAACPLYHIPRVIEYTLESAERTSSKKSMQHVVWPALENIVKCSTGKHFCAYMQKVDIQRKGQRKGKAAQVPACNTRPSIPEGATDLKHVQGLLNHQAEVLRDSHVIHACFETIECRILWQPPIEIGPCEVVYSILCVRDGPVQDLSIHVLWQVLVQSTLNWEGLVKELFIKTLLRFMHHDDGFGGGVKLRAAGATHHLKDIGDRVVDIPALLEDSNDASQQPIATSLELAVLPNHKDAQTKTCSVVGRGYKPYNALQQLH
jgi:hypothetical protein